jgi:3-deoxy-manno-octulosonate cytidylyltransferase (CMP-KDO synthetase)
MLKAVVVIPARYASTRFPGKVLMASPEGKPVLQYVVEAAQRARRAARVLVATDDARIGEAVEAFGGEARMTGDHACGSDRVAEVAAGLEAPLVINLQADEPGILPEQIDHCVELLEEDRECVISSLAVRIESQEELDDPNAVKVVVDESWRALYFSRSPIPHVRDARAPFAESPMPHLRHLGIYAYRRPFLLEYAAFGPHPLERAEKLEQLRALAHGYMIKIGLTVHRSAKVDTPEDFEAFMQEFSDRVDA